MESFGHVQLGQVQVQLLVLTFVIVLSYALWTEQCLSAVVMCSSLEA